MSLYCFEVIIEASREVYDLEPDEEFLLMILMIYFR